MFKTQTKGRSYIVQDYPEAMPYKISKAKTDKALKKMLQASEALRDAIKEIYDEDYKAYYFIAEEVLGMVGLSFSGGKAHRIEDLINEITYAQEMLAMQDEIPSEEEIITLESLGYKNVFSAPIWEKEIENNDIHEIVDEVQVSKDGNVLRRIRTTIWDISPGCKSSRSINYKKVRAGKKFAAAARNSARNKAERDKQYSSYH